MLPCCALPHFPVTASSCNCCTYCGEPTLAYFMKKIRRRNISISLRILKHVLIVLCIRRTVFHHGQFLRNFLEYILTKPPTIIKAERPAKTVFKFLTISSEQQLTSLMPQVLHPEVCRSRLSLLQSLQQPLHDSPLHSLMQQHILCHLSQV